MFVDSHCHIHDTEFYDKDRELVYGSALEGGVKAMVCVGTSVKSSHEAIAFAETHDGAYASIGVHPHDTIDGWSEIQDLASDTSVGKLVAIGEIGLDYFYNHSPRDVQIKALEAQLQIATSHNLPVIFHVREAFSDFWPIIDNFHGLRGVLHSFTDNQSNLERGFEHGFYVGVNGISTFTKDPAQREMYANIPLQRMILETDAPFLAPHPHRGKTNQPAFIRDVAQFHAGLRGVDLSAIAQITSDNAYELFDLKKFDRS